MPDDEQLTLETLVADDTSDEERARLAPELATLRRKAKAWETVCARVTATDSGRLRLDKHDLFEIAEDAGLVPER